MVILRHEDYKIGWICALYSELAAATAMLDERHGMLSNLPNDENTYVFGSIGSHNIVITSLPEGEMGTSAATHVATQMKRSFKLKFGLLVGIAGGVPNLKKERDIRLGDIVVSSPKGSHSGVLQYDYGKLTPDSFEVRGALNAPAQALRTAVTKLRAEHVNKDKNRIPDYLSPIINKNLPREFAYPEEAPDELFKAEYEHIKPHKTCVKCDHAYLVDRSFRSSDPVVHYGIIGSGNQVMANAIKRDEASKHDIYCFEMEAAGVMNILPFIVIRGISDYADSHKNDKWKHYATVTAAAYAKELLRFVTSEQVESDV